MIVSYDKKVLINIPFGSKNFEIKDNKGDLGLFYVLDGEIEKYDLNFPQFQNISEKSFIIRINNTKLEIYRCK